MRTLAMTMILVFTLLLGCSGSSFGSNNQTVGPYKYPDKPEWQKEDAKFMGHRNSDIYNPTQTEIENTCTICHYIY